MFKVDIIKQDIIQPMWPIEENARIVRNWVWFKPPKPPTIAERPLIIAVSFTFMGERIN